MARYVPSKLQRVNFKTFDYLNRLLKNYKSQGSSYNIIVFITCLKNQIIPWSKWSVIGLLQYAASKILVKFFFFAVYMLKCCRYFLQKELTFLVSLFVIIIFLFIYCIVIWCLLTLLYYYRYGAHDLEVGLCSIHLYSHPCPHRATSLRKSSHLCCLHLVDLICDSV